MDNNKIMDYLYGEMSDNERKQFEIEMDQNEALRKEVDALKGVRSFLNEHKDEPIPSSTVVVEKQGRVVRLSKWWAIAASLLILLTLGKMLDFRVSIGEGQMVMGFGPIEKEDKNEVQEPTITRDQMANMLADLKKELRDELEEQGQLIAQSEQKITDQRAEMNRWMKEVKSDQVKFTQAFWDEYNRDQNVFTTRLVNDFIEYNETQRQEDLDMINKGFSDLAQMIQINLDPAANLVYQTKQK